MSSRLSRNTLILLANNGVAAFLAFALTVIIARGLGDTALGQYAAIMAWALSLTLLAEFGLGTLITRNVAQDRAAAADYLGAIHPLRWALGGSLILIVWLVAPWLSDDPQVVNGLRIAVWLVPIDSLFASYTAVFRAWEVMWPILALNTGYLTLQVVGALVIVAGDGSVTALLAVIVLADALQLAATWGLWRRLRRKRFTSPPGPLSILERGSNELNTSPITLLSSRQLLRAAWPFMLAGVLATLQARAILLILQANAPAEVVGWYAAASRTMEAVRMLPQAVFGALFPVLAALVIDPPRLQRTFRKATLLLSAYSLLLGLFALLGAKPLIRFVFGAEFDEAGGALAVLAWALPLWTLRGLLSLWCYAHGREWTVNRLTVVALALQVGVGVALVGRYGLMGATWTVVMGEAVLAGLLWGAIKLNPSEQK